MEFSLIYITVLLVSLIASVFVILTNMRDSKDSVSKLDFRVISVQLIILLAWIMILSKALRAQTLEESIINVAVFIFSLVMGVSVIQSVIKENKASEITNKLIKSLSVYNRRLRNLDKQKTDFISTASHQLRGPVSVSLGYSSMLLDGDYGKLNDEQKKAVKTILDSGNNLNAIINELLDTSRIEQNRVQYKLSEFDLIDVIEEVSDFYKDIANKKGLKFVQDFNLDYSATIKADQEKIKQVVMNLLDNSFKYTNEGEVKISVKKTAGKVLISISDTGIGIRTDELEGIFNKFVRASNAEETDITGSGLGLFIAREIVISNKGKIWAQSKGQGQGTEFFVEFKLVD
jgi:signal transduction histidine kinase